MANRGVSDMSDRAAMSETKSAKGAATRDQILDAASRLISLRGYHCTSLDDVLRESGVGKGNFYYYFKSKEDLGYAIIVNKRFWDGLPGDVRVKLEQAIAEATEYANRIAREKNDADLERLRAAGTTQIHVPTPAERLALKRALLPVHARAEGRLGSALLEDVYRAAGFDPERP